MKFSERRFSPLKFLAKKVEKTQYLHVDELDKEEVLAMGEGFIPNMRKLIEGIDKNNIIYPSDTFRKAAITAGMKTFFPHITEYSEFLNGVSGVLLQKDLTIFYYIKRIEDGNVFITFSAIANTSNTLIGFSLPSPPEMGERKQHMWFSSLFQRPDNADSLSKRELIEYQYLYVHYMITSVLLFKRYATVETKTFLAGEKTKYLGQKCINDTKQNITYLDSHWFTNIIKSAGFGVRGHFRLQPCGVGMKDRKLIWIESFEKTGYTAPARKLKQESE